jgi:hypothetical protein
MGDELWGIVAGAVIGVTSIVCPPVGISLAIGSAVSVAVGNSIGVDDGEKK